MRKLHEAAILAGIQDNSYNDAYGEEAKDQRQAKEIKSNEGIASLLFEKIKAEQGENDKDRTVKSRALDIEERRRQDEIWNKQLELLIKGTGVGGAGVGSEQQKLSNMADVARNSLNNTESLVKQNPKTAGIQTLLQSVPLIGDPLANAAAGVIGGKFKEIRDSKASTKEAMQNLYTGASASGEQVPAFQGFSGPGAMDAFRGKVEGTSDNTRDALNTFQQKQLQKQQMLTPEVVKVAGLDQDPVAQQIMRQQQEAQAALRQQKIQKMVPSDQQLYQEIAGNPGHPKAAKAKQYLERKYGPVF
jgi:hypothetical protein